MSKSLFSKEGQDALKAFKSQLSNTGNSDAVNKHDQKPTEPVNLPSKKQVAKKVRQLNGTAKPSATPTDDDAASPMVDDDKVLFLQAMSGVQPLDDKNTVQHDTNAPKPTAHILSKRAAAQGEDIVNQANLSDMQALMNPVSGEAFLSFKRPTIQNKVFNQLKQGKLIWHDAVDLHGSSIDEARGALNQIIQNALTNNETCIKIVHGKGEDAIIKTCVNGWLQQIPEVLAFCSAPTNQGGNGAVLVLLKRAKRQDTLST